MSFQLVTRAKARFKTAKGELTVEQLWDLGLPELDKLCVKLKRETKKETESFLQVETKEDLLTKAMFDVALEILRARVAEQEAARMAQENKEHNEKILALINKKRDNALENMTEEELLAKLK